MTAGVVTAHLDDVPTLRFDSDAEPDWKPLRTTSASAPSA
jgi:hypothetical protein